MTQGNDTMPTILHRLETAAADPCVEPIRAFLRRAAEVAETEGGGDSVPLATLARLAGELAAEMADAPRAVFESQRHQAFERVLTRAFADLLPSRTGDDGRPHGAPLSRRLIRGLMKALTMMAGEDAMAERRLLASNLLTTHRARTAGRTDWTALARDPLMTRLVRATLMTAAEHFGAFERRVDWLCMVIDNHRPPAYEEDADPDWRCTPDVAITLLDALYADLSLTLAQPGGEARLTAEHGEEAVLALRAVLGNIAARRQVVAAA